MSDEPKNRDVDAERAEANMSLGTGLGIGAFGVASATLLGAVCPMCVVAAPALIGYGIYKRVQCSRAESVSDDALADDDPQVGAPSPASRS